MKTNRQFFFTQISAPLVCGATVLGFCFLIGKFHPIDEENLGVVDCFLSLFYCANGPGGPGSTQCSAIVNGITLYLRNALGWDQQKLSEFLSVHVIGDASTFLQTLGPGGRSPSFPKPDGTIPNPSFTVIQNRDDVLSATSSDIDDIKDHVENVLRQVSCVSK